MEAIGSFEELCQHFTDKLSGLGEAIAIQACLESRDEDEREETAQPMESLWQELEELTTVLTLLRSKCADQRTELENIQAVKENLQAFVKGVHYTNSNIPPHLPVPSTSTTQITSNSQEPAVHTAAVVTQGHSQVAATPSIGKRTVSVTDKSQNRNGGNGNGTKQTSPPCPQMEYLTVDEFKNVPQYMKGRLSYQQVNSVVDEMNKTLTAKYKLMRQKRTTLNDSQRERYEALKLQETKDTKGLHFVVEGDLKDWSSLKMSKETRSILTILRHSGRICEIRGGGHTRLVLIETY